MGNNSSRNNGRRATHASAVKKQLKKKPSAPPACKRKTMFVYPTCDWDEKHILRMESHNLIATREEPLSTTEEIPGTHECGICFNVFKGVLNQLACCNYEICTECFLQLRAPPENFAKPSFARPEKASLCPYCRTAEFEVNYPPVKVASSNVAKKHTCEHTEMKEAKASKARPKADLGPHADTCRATSSKFVQPVGDPETLEEIEHLMLMAALANSSLEQEHAAAAGAGAAAAAATTTSAHASAASAATDTARNITMTRRAPTTSRQVMSDLEPQSPPLLPLSSRRPRANTPELSAENPKQTRANEHPVMFPLTI